MTVSLRFAASVFTILCTCAMGTAVRSAGVDLRQSSMVKAMPGCTIEGEGREVLHAFAQWAVKGVEAQAHLPGMDKVLAQKRQELAFLELPDMTPAFLTPWLHAQWYIEGDGTPLPTVVHNACLLALQNTEEDIDQRVAGLIVAAMKTFPEYLTFIQSIIVQIGVYHDRLIVSFRHDPGATVPASKREAIAETSLFFEDLAAFVQVFRGSVTRMGRYLYRRALQAKHASDEQAKWAKQRGEEKEVALMKARNVLARFVTRCKEHKVPIRKITPIS